MKLKYGKSDILSKFTAKELPYEMSRQYIDAFAWYSGKSIQPSVDERYMDCYNNLFELLKSLNASAVIFVYWAAMHTNEGLAKIRFPGFLNGRQLIADFQEWYRTNNDESVYLRVKDQKAKGILLPAADPCMKMEYQIIEEMQLEERLLRSAVNQLQALPRTRKICKKASETLENEYGVLWII